MALTILIEASPRNPATGAVVPARLAGGGQGPLNHRGYSDWRDCIVARPLFAAEFGFDENGWTGAAIPQTGAIAVSSGDPTYVDQLAALVWANSAIAMYTGDDALAVPVWTTEIVGTVAGASVKDGVFSITLSDLSGALNVPVAPATFAGTGGLEGVAEAEGRVKRRSWGRLFNIEGRILDKANNIWEFGDPAFPIQSFLAVKDKGRAGPTTLVGWAGSAAATLTALRAASAPAGGAAIAPSIACVKWWTTNPTPLTADIEGEIGTGYVATVAGIVQRMITARAPTITVSGGAAIDAVRGDVAGIHIESSTETLAQALDRLLLAASVNWTMTAAGALQLLTVSYSNPVETIAFESVERVTSMAPISTVKVGYQKNHRLHDDGEISAALLGSDLVLLDGRTGEQLADDVDQALLDAQTFRQAAPPAEAVEGNYWTDIDDNNLTMRHGGLGLFINGVEITFNGDRLCIPWVAVQDQKVLQAIDAAAAVAARVTQAELALVSIASDGILSRGEKHEVNRQVSAITNEYPGIIAQAASLGITTERVAYIAAYDALLAYLASLPNYADTAFDTPIVGATFTSNFVAYYTARAALMSKNDAVAATRAQWSGVTGTGGQPSGADVAATVSPGGGVAANMVGTTALLANTVSRVVAVQNSSGTSVAPNATAIICSISLPSIVSNMFIVQASVTFARQSGTTLADHKRGQASIEYQINGGAWTFLGGTGDSQFVDPNGTVCIATGLLFTRNINAVIGSPGDTIGFRLLGTCAGDTGGNNWTHSGGGLYALEIRR